MQTANMADALADVLHPTYFDRMITEGFRRNARVLVCARCDSDEPEHATLAIDAIDKHTPVGKIRTALLVAYERERKAKAAA